MLGAFRTLHFAARPRVVSRYLGQLLLIVAGLTLVPAAVSWMSGRPDIAWRYLVVIGGLAIAGGLGARQRCADRIQPNEAFAVSALAFLIPGLAMAFPLVGYGITPVDAVFEAVSGVTTTGLSTIEDLDHRPRAFYFSRAWLQWVGGLGVVILALAFMTPSGAAARRLGFSDRETGDVVGSTKGHARRIVLVYLALTAAGYVASLLAGLDWFDSLVTVFAAISTGGFATSGASLEPLTLPGRAVVSGICLLGALSFSLYYAGSIRTVLRASQLWTLAAFVVLGTLVVGGSLAASGAAAGVRVWLDALWTVVSAQTTAGFSTTDVSVFPPGAKLALLLCMGVGGEVGSTAGGFKIVRLVILLHLLTNRILRASMSEGSHVAPRIDGATVDAQEVEQVATLALAYGVMTALAWLAFLLYGADPMDALFDVVSALSTVGLSTGAIAPDTEPVLKMLVCIVMLMGRLEIVAFLVLMFPGTWVGRRRVTS